MPCPTFSATPATTSWFDLWNLRWQPATVNALGEPIDTIFWGIKNYVEGGNYVGIVTWILAGIAVAGGFMDRRPPTDDGRPQIADDRPQTTDGGRKTQHATRNSPFTLHHSPFTTPTWLFTGLALLSLLFAFGTPLYAILFYGLPGWNQLHSPFRWVFPLTLSLAVLGGIGLEALRSGLRYWILDIGRIRINIQYLISNITILAGLAALAAVAASYFIPGPFLALGQRIVEGSDLAQMAFADGRMFWGYQSVNLLQFGIVAVLSGVLVGWQGARGKGTKDEGRKTKHALHTSQFALLFLLFADLYAAHGSFNPASDPALVAAAQRATRGGVYQHPRGVDRRRQTADRRRRLASRQSPVALPFHHLQPARVTRLSTPMWACFTAGKTSAATTRLSRANMWR